MSTHLPVPRPDRDSGADAASRPPRRCAQCGVSIRLEAEAHLPFCSRRCQQLDLSNWLGERYGLPYEDPAGESVLPDPEGEGEDGD